MIWNEKTPLLTISLSALYQANLLVSKILCPAFCDVWSTEIDAIIMQEVVIPLFDNFKICPLLDFHPDSAV